MTTFVILVLIVLFGALLMGKMMMDLYPGPVTDWFKKKNTEDAHSAD